MCDHHYNYEIVNTEPLDDNRYLHRSQCTKCHEECEFKSVYKYPILVSVYSIDRTR